MKTFSNLLSGRRKLIFLAAVLAFCRCVSSGADGPEKIKTKAVEITAGNDTLLKVVLKEIKDTADIFLSDLVEDLEAVQLDEDENAFVSMGKTVVSEDYIGVLGNSGSPFKLFDRKTGKFLADIGALGRGPGEYFAVYSAQIDQKRNRVFLLPWQSSEVLVYDLQGNMLEPVPIPYFMPKAGLRVDPAADKIAIGILPFKNSGQPVALQTDFKGNVLAQAPAEYLRLAPDFGNEIYTDGNVPEFGFSLLTWQGKPDSLYHFLPEENRIKAVYTIDFGYEAAGAKREERPYGGQVTEGTPIHHYGELPDSYIASIAFPRKVPGTNNVVTSAPVWLRTEKGSLKTYFFRLKNDFLGGYQVWPGFVQGYFISNTEPQDFLKKLDDALEKGKMEKAVKERIEKLKKDIDEEGNNVILIGKLK